ncbi:MAG: FAD-binding oxidoreductase [Stellaceae bacterium]
MNRRRVLTLAGTVPLLSVLGRDRARAATPAGALHRTLRRVRPSDPEWPNAALWQALNRRVGGHLFVPRSPLAVCAGADGSQPCQEVLANLRNPYFLGDEPALTESSGWADAWRSAPSAYAIAARTTADVAAAVDFARTHHLRLVIKGGGHSYQGTSNAPDSLLIWTRAMNRIALHDAFVPQGCAGRQAAEPAVTVGAGAIWMHTYEAVTTRGGRYVQGGGCATVGVAGLIQSGGFGSFSKRFGTAAAGLLEAEIVTADGAVRIANACTHPDLFWALKGGGGSSFGVVTRLILRTHELPEWFGIVFLTVRAASDAAFRRLIGAFLDFYHDRLFNPHWGESVAFSPDHTLAVTMVSQGLDTRQMQDAWRPFLALVAAAPKDFSLVGTPKITRFPARHLWDPAWMKANAPGIMVSDPRPGAPSGNVWFAGDGHEAGAFWHGYRSAWLPAALLEGDQHARLADALFAGSRHWRVALHCNKGLAGAPQGAIAAAADTATNPHVLTAFALAILGAAGPPAFAGMPGPAPDLEKAREDAAAIGKAMGELRRLAPDTGSYVSESDFFETDWERAFWGRNYPRLQAVKARYDSDGLFFVHHGVGSEDWSTDGFTRI